MRAVTLLYHDVIAEGDHFDSSGRPGRAPASFKLSERSFDAHLDLLRAVAAAPPLLVTELAGSQGAPEGQAPLHLMLTFDDGGVSAHSLVADRLESIGWRGHFLVTSGCVGESGYLTGSQMRELRDRGHLIGSHSATHPMRMSALPTEKLIEEWSTSARTLEDILGEPVTVASVPGGYYSRKVGEAAASSGIRYLFNSEPTLRIGEVSGCAIIGRYSLRRGSSPDRAADLALARFGLRTREATLWEAKKLAKQMGGTPYLRLRKILLG